MDQQYVIISLIKWTNNTHYGTFSAMTCLFYDIVITFDEEVRLIWKSKWSLPKILYLLNRYLTCILFVVLLIMQRTTFISSNKACIILLDFVTWAEHLVLLSLEVILMMRTFALYQRNRIVIFALAAGFLAKTGINTYVLVKVIGRINWTSFRLSGLLPQSLPAEGCIGLTPPLKLFNNYWYLTLILEAILFLLTLINFVRHWQASRSLGVLRKARLMNTLLRDGSLFFAAVVAILIYNTVTFNVQRYTDNNHTFLIFNYSIFSIAGCRLILSLRSESIRMRNKSHPNGTNVELTSMHFAAGAAASNVLEETLSGFRVVSTIYGDVGSEPGSVDALPEEDTVDDADFFDRPRGGWLADWRTEFDSQSVAPAVSMGQEESLQV